MPAVLDGTGLAPLGQGDSQGTATAATVVHTSPDCNSLAHALAAAAVAPGPVAPLGAVVLATRTFALAIAAGAALRSAADGGRTTDAALDAIFDATHGTRTGALHLAPSAEAEAGGARRAELANGADGDGTTDEGPAYAAAAPHEGDERRSRADGNCARTRHRLAFAAAFTVAAAPAAVAYIAIGACAAARIELGRQTTSSWPAVLAFRNLSATRAPRMSRRTAAATSATATATGPCTALAHSHAFHSPVPRYQPIPADRGDPAREAQGSLPPRRVDRLSPEVRTKKVQSASPRAWGALGAPSGSRELRPCSEMQGPSGSRCEDVAGEDVAVEDVASTAAGRRPPRRAMRLRGGGDAEQDEAWYGEDGEDVEQEMAAEWAERNAGGEGEEWEEAARAEEAAGRMTEVEAAGPASQGGRREGETASPLARSPTAAEVEEACTKVPTRAQGATKSVGAKAKEIQLAYWNAGNLHASCGDAWTVGKRRTRNELEPEEAKAARRKWEWLEAQLAADRPTVLFLFEVSGSRAHWKGLRSRLMVAGYKADMVSGAGGRNGIVVAVDKLQGKLARTVSLAERTVGVRVRCDADLRDRHFVGVHGKSKESPAALVDAMGEPIPPTRAAPEQCFAWQLHEAVHWLEEAGGGVLCGDFNRVVCGRWRNGGDGLMGDDDRLLRRAAGWRCSCCDDGVTPKLGGVIGWLDPTGCAEPEWTRWSSTKRSRSKPTSRIDYAMQIGAIREPWQSQPQAEAVAFGRSVSDHDYQRARLQVVEKAGMAARRPKPLPLGPTGDQEARTAYMQSTAADPTAATQIRAAGEAMQAERGDALGGQVRWLRERGEEAMRVAAESRDERRRNSAAKTRAAESPRQRYQQWVPRLKTALRLQAAGREPKAILREGPWAGCVAVRRILARSKDGTASTWQRIVRRCRDEVTKAAAAVRKAERDSDAKLLEEALKPAQAGEDAVQRMQKLWRAMAEQRASTALEAVWEGDKPPKGADDGSRRITYSEPGFGKALGAIGRAFVKKMADTPACVPAFKAWCEVFMEAYTPLVGRDGGDFVLANELTWDVFQEALACMPSGKAVGAGGFSAELLRAAGEAVQRAFYEALICDVREKQVPDEWRTVLYALLVKPAPSNADVVSERREIALMAHDMKLLLQMVRRVSYQRILGRMSSAQAGWLGGFGCTDPGLSLTHVIQQSARLKLPLWILYIDLSTFFGRMDRRVTSIAEALHGLPAEVSELAERIYGKACGKGETEPDGQCVTCHYDSAGGLGEGFQNHMGALMGCVLSPDKAKLLLNTVLVAIEAVCSGVELWGFDVEAAARRVCHMAFADDWCGTFQTLGDLRNAWKVWTMWEAVSGSKLGVKAQLKTVVTGVRYVDGVAKAMVDPQLHMRDGSTVPFLRHDEAYKHLGNMRRADGDDAAAWKKLRGVMEAALARLRRLRRVTAREFIAVSNALIGGLAGYYLQTLYVTFEQAEIIERKWRSIYRRKFGESLEEAGSKPRVYYYRPVKAGGLRRLHLWGVGLAALTSNVNNAVADVDDTTQRAAARSMVALAMERWGCRSDPQHWHWEHLAADIETSLARSKCRQLGDAWMLATALLEREHRADHERAEPNLSAWARDFGSEQRAAWGRWAGEAPTGDPLHAEAAHWQPPASALLHEPTSKGGLGLPVEPLLLRAGVVATGHMCRTIRARDGCGCATWEEDYEAACRRNPRLPRHGAASKAWERQIARVMQCGASPCTPEAVGGSGEQPTIGDDRAYARAVGTRVDEAVTAQVMRDLSNPDTCSVRAERRWKRLIQACFPDVQPRPRREWQCGGRDRGEEARGPRVVMAVSGDDAVSAYGGEQSWLARGVSSGTDEWHVGEDGWASGHEALEESLLGMLDFDARGLPIDGRGARLREEQLAALPPAQQMQARAALRVTELRGDELEVVDEWPPTKRKDTHFNLAVQRHNRRRLARVQARTRATAMYTLDATRSRVTLEKEQTEYVVARAAARHDGAVFGGRMHEPEGHDNYLGELAAQLDAAAAECEGGRVIIMFDATSPVLAAKRCSRASHRKQQGYLAGEWLRALSRLWQRAELVVFLWQTSHVGDPCNEWADLLAAAAAMRKAVVAVPRLPSASASMQYTMPRRSTQAWASRLAAEVVDVRLLETVVDSQLHDEYDVPQLPLDEAVRRTCEAVLSQRSCIGDEKRYLGAARRVGAGDRLCPFGCKGADGERPPFTWAHAQLVCSHPELVEGRRAWLTECQRCAALMQPEGRLEGRVAPHSQTIMAMAAIERGVANSGKARPLRGHEEVMVRRFAGGLIRTTGSSELDRSRTLREGLVTMVTAGVAVQQAAHKLTLTIEQCALKEAQGTHDGVG